jgi:hypothetical protein
MKFIFIFSNMMDQTPPPTTVSSLKFKLFVIITLSIAISLIIIIGIFLLTTTKDRESSSKIAIIQSLKSKQSTLTTTTTTTTTLSPEEIQRLSSFKEFLNISSNRPYPNLSHSMDKFMRLVYRQVYDESDTRRRKRHSNLYLSDETDFIISLPNQYHHSSASKIGYHFEYNASLEYLSHAELVLPIHHISTIQISSSTFNISLKQPFQKDKNWLKISLTQYIKSFPLTFHLTFTHTKQKPSSLSSGFLTLYFRRHSISRRDLSSFYDSQLITYPDDPSYCQVRPLRTSFSELNWSSWVIEPSSYEMNICSGTCHTGSNMGTYFIIQNLLNQKYPKKIPAPCCRPKRFSSTILLYYDGPNLVLKRHENMRVVECGCSS